MPGQCDNAKRGQSGRTTLPLPSGLWWLAVIALGFGAACAAPSSEHHEHAASTTEGGAPPLYDTLGTLHHPITTRSQTAQAYFDQGLRFVFAFNHEEAINSFEEASRHDPDAPMPYWGVALALGPNINLPMDRDAERWAHAAIQEALARLEKATPSERAYIEALAKRYSTAEEAKREELDRAYADAMGEVWRRLPEDPDAGTLYAEALMDLQPWNYWTDDSRPKGRADDIVATLEAVLRKNPNHPGACHYYIHAVESSDRPERALACAERLATLMPGAGHLVHMPSHVYIRLGMYEKAAEHNSHATETDSEYLRHRHLTGIYAMGYYPHNIHFLWMALQMEGRSQEAGKRARELVSKVSPDAVEKSSEVETFMAVPLFGHVRFGHWDAVLKEPKPQEKLRYTTGIWHFARGMAFAARGAYRDAEQERARLRAVREALPMDRMVVINPATSLLAIADHLLAGDLAARQRHTDEALSHLWMAVTLEDGLRYMEPPEWPVSSRHALGAALLKAGLASDAEKVYREDLKRFPNNGWALYGLAQSLRAQRKDEATAVEDRFNEAWARADITLTSSWM